MSEIEQETFGSISFQVVLNGLASLRPITVHLDSASPRINDGSNRLRGQTAENHSPEDEGNLPKCACRECGSVQLRSDLDTYQVFLAQDDKLVHLRSEGTPGGLQGLYCYECGKEIEAGCLGDIRIE